MEPGDVYISTLSGKVTILEVDYLTSVVIFQFESSDAKYYSTIQVINEAVDTRKWRKVISTPRKVKKGHPLTKIFA